MRDPKQVFKPQAWLSTNLEYTPEQILPWFVRRWTMEGTCEDAWTHVGMATQRPWNDRAMAGTPPRAVEPLRDRDADRPTAARAGSDLHAQHGVVSQNAPHIFGGTCLGPAPYLGSSSFFPVPQQETDMMQIPRALFERFIDAVCYAA
jgi:hypothetical protein